MKNLTYWYNYTKEIGLDIDATLGLAFYIGSYPTMISLDSNRPEIVEPLKDLICGTDKKIKIDKELALDLYGLFYGYSSTINKNLSPALFGENKDFSEYLKLFQIEEDKLCSPQLKTMQVILFFKNIGVIIKSKINKLQDAFMLGHDFSLNIYNQNKIIKDDIFSTFNNLDKLPQFLASAVNYFPDKVIKSYIDNEKLWILSKILFVYLRDYRDVNMAEKIWFFHNYVFYKNEKGTLNIKDEFDLHNPKFSDKLILGVLQNFESFWGRTIKFNKIDGINIGEFNKYANKRFKLKYSYESEKIKSAVVKGEVYEIFMMTFVNYTECLIELSEKK